MESRKELRLVNHSIKFQRSPLRTTLGLGRQTQQVVVMRPVDSVLDTAASRQAWSNFGARRRPPDRPHPRGFDAAAIVDGVTTWSIDWQIAASSASAHDSHIALQLTASGHLRRQPIELTSVFRALPKVLQIVPWTLPDASTHRIRADRGQRARPPSKYLTMTKRV